MYKLFNNILIPVDSSVASDKLVEKGIEIANSYFCHIHLLYCVSRNVKSQALAKIKNIFSFTKNRQEEKSVQKLKNIASAFQSKLKNGLNIFFHSENGNKNEIAIKYIIQNKIDLVLGMIRPQRIKWNTLCFDATRIVEKTSAAVITLPENRHIARLYSIVIPVTDFIPLRKLMYGIYLTRYYNITFHLLGITRELDSEFTERVQKYLHRSYQLIRDNCNATVDLIEYAGANAAAVIKKFVSDNHTDLIIVNPGEKSRLKNNTSGWFTNILQKNNYTSVLTISDT
ncbi:MAG: universal stress protein [Bacteroidetes bacterium]|nr:universal stress protein [Bacteroidota bacterium]MBS1929555.1 universal stress protein [Bacteroidota bacterium]